MSQKITAKNLQFNRSLPPFLARLRGEADADRGDGPDPILAARRRPTKPRSASEEAEDAPVVVDEQGNVVEGDAVEVHKDGSVTVKPEEGTKTEEGKEEEEEGKDADGKATAPTAQAENLASVGGPRKKRKIARVVGAAEENDGGGDGGDKDADGDRKASGKSASAGTEKTTDITNGTGSSATTKDKPKKKAKKIKLSFDDDT